MFFFFIKCAPFILKIEEALNIDDIKIKAFEIDKLHLKMNLNIFVSNVLLTLKIMNFEKCVFNKNYFIFVLF